MPLQRVVTWMIWIMNKESCSTNRPSLNGKCMIDTTYIDGLMAKMMLSLNLDKLVLMDDSSQVNDSNYNLLMTGNSHAEHERIITLMTNMRKYFIRWNNGKGGNDFLVTRKYLVKLAEKTFNLLTGNQDWGSNVIMLMHEYAEVSSIKFRICLTISTITQMKIKYLTAEIAMLHRW